MDHYEANAMLYIPETEPSIDDRYIRFVEDKEILMKMCYKLIYESYDILSDYVRLNNIDIKLLKPMDHVVQLRLWHVDNQGITLDEQIALYEDTINVVSNTLLTLDIKVNLSLLDIALFEIVRMIETSIEESRNLLEVAWFVRLACVKLIDLIESIQEVPQEKRISKKDANMLVFTALNLDV